jgi:hypothetical protein
MRDALLRDGDPYIKELCYLPLPVKKMTLRSQLQEKIFDSFQSVVGNAHEMKDVLRHTMEARSHVIGFIIWKVRAMRRASSSGVHHQAILQATDISEAKFLKLLWGSHPENVDCKDGLKTGSRLSIATISSLMSREECSDVIDRLKSSQLDAIIHVGMIGEGFDHPQLSVCGIFCHFATMPPYVQLVGRIARRIQGAGEEDNVGFIIAHPGLGLHKHWNLYKQEQELPDDSQLALNGAPSSDWTDVEETYEYDDQSTADWFLSMK